MAVEHLHIKKIRIENYKSLRNTEIELKDGLNIIIGKNGAGKSNMLGFIYRYASRMPFARFGIPKNISANFSVLLSYKSDKKSQALSYSLERNRAEISNIGRYIYEITINKSEGKNQLIHDKKIKLENDFNSLSAEEKDLRKEFTRLRLTRRYLTFTIPEDSAWIMKPIRILIDKTDDNEVSIEDEDSFSFFKPLEFQLEYVFFIDLLTEERSVDFIKEKLLIFLDEYLAEYGINFFLKENSQIEKIRFSPNINIYSTEQNVIIENLYVEFLVNKEWIPWSHLSDGTKRMFYLISECISLNKGLLLIEEPELGIHPHQLYKLMAFLKEQSREKQIIISTHSPLVLDVLNEKELNRIIIAEYNNGTKFRNLSKAEMSKAKAYIKEVGEISYYWLHSDLEQ